MRMRVLMGIDTKLMIPVVWGGTINGGEGASCFAVDFSGKKLIIYSVGAPDNQETASGYTTTELNTTVIPDNVIGAREYIIELHKDGTNHILRLFDTLTGEKVEVSHNGWAAGRQNQYYGFYVDSGTLPTIMNMEVWSLNKPDVVFAGDSITEGVMVVDRSRRYAEQFRTNNPLKKVVISARGGDTIDGILAKFATEYNIYRPKKLSVLIGANGGNTLAKLQQLKSNCDAINCTLILNYRTCQFGTNMHIDGNNLIAQIGVNGARFDIATALNNNPIGATDGSDPRYNPALYYGTGGLHPNNDGDDKMYNRLIVDVPEMFYL
jgi:lysophospholipase L1-like esterase